MLAAQINLFLRVMRRREDGYHDLASLFHVRLDAAGITELLLKFSSLLRDAYDQASSRCAGPRCAGPRLARHQARACARGRR